MDEERRLNRVQWVRDTPDLGTGSAGNTPAPWAGFPGGNNPPPWTGLPGGSNPPQWRLGEGDDPSNWGMFPGEDNASSSPVAGAFGQDPVPGMAGMAGAAYGHELLAGDLADQQMYGEEFYDEEMYEEGMYGEEGYFMEEIAPEEEKHPLRDALLVLVILYVVCCIAPLFLGLFVPLRVFFWLEVAGWILIVGWLILGVRAPFMVWYKERQRIRRENPPQEQLGEEFAEEL